MASPFTLPDDDGTLCVHAPGGAQVTLDLYEASNTYAGLSERFDDAVQLACEWVAWLNAKGLTGLSHGQAFMVADAVASGVAEFKKKFAPGPCSPTPGSPGSTASAPSD